MPVTNQERVMKDGCVLISKTDAKGIITYANQDFVNISGYSEEELIGAPHNIVRHPDMPPAAFADLWATLKKGRAWSGLVKNRSKNGDYYWVEATARPNAEGGFTSVRVKPDREQVQQAEALYKAMREGKTRKIILNGQVVVPSLTWRLLTWARGIRVDLRLWLATLGVAGLFGALLIRSLLQGDMPQVGLGSLGVAFSLALGFWLTFDVLRPLGAAVTTAERLAKGDLATPLTGLGNNEIGKLMEALGAIRNNFHETVYYLREGVDKLNAATQSLTADMARASSASHAQAEAASTVAAAMEQMTASIEQVGEYAHGAGELSRRSSEQSEAGGRVVHEAADEMRTISDTVYQASSVIQELETHSKEISNIVTVIEEIAEQTNLLALNAAIEAARAGESGRGFAVVADEVRKLAERTSRSTHEISGMVNKIQSGAHQAVASMEAGVNRVAEGVQLAHQAGDSITQIQESARQVIGAVDDIANALREQSATSQDIARHIEQIAHMSEEGSAAAANTTQSAQNLQAMAEHLNKIVTQFKI
ncbi:MAG: PAS domain-containing methyl-accepting chemotaxis protein [Pseudomonadota bacterium]